MATIVVTAAPGRRVRLSPSQVLEPGRQMTLPLTVFVMRRLAAGDLVEVSASSASAPSASASSASTGGDAGTSTNSSSGSK